MIFPEGGRSPDGWGQEFRGGAAYLAARTGRPVIPVHLDGTRHILPKGGGGVRRSPTTITFGIPLVPDDGESARRFGVRVEAAVAALADERNTDWWTARRRAAGGTTPPLQGPDTAAWRRAWALPARPDAVTGVVGDDGADDDGGGDAARPGPASDEPGTAGRGRSRRDAYCSDAVMPVRG